MFDGINKLADMTGCQWDDDARPNKDELFTELGLQAPTGVGTKAVKFVSANAAAASSKL